ncbi:MAG TPA: 3-deoxy-7-phosphoheptulonate synthase, partial [Bacteroidales bacterium]|nr:3-deoxy-7-phosphoheptulonate synthase [Bacteroidales bacterium]
MKLNSPGEENQTAENSFAPMIISGPCSAESEEQLINTALGLKELPRLDYFRAGIWKPRTRPGDFEGLGAQGLNLMQKVKELTGFRLMIEVAKPSYIEQAL